jgi:hypothetical protein
MLLNLPLHVWIAVMEKIQPEELIKLQLLNRCMQEQITHNRSRLARFDAHVHLKPMTGTYPNSLK